MIHAGSLSLLTWGFDPALAIALRFAQAEGLLAQVSNGYALTEKGRDFIKNALKNPSIFATERAALAEVGRVITEGMVEQVAKDWK